MKKIRERSKCLGVQVALVKILENRRPDRPRCIVACTHSAAPCCCRNRTVNRRAAIRRSTVKESVRRHIKVWRSAPFSLTSQWPPRSGSADLPKQVIFSSSTWQSPAGPAYPHPIPFSFPCSWKKRDRDKGICLTVGSCFMWSIWESGEERREVFWRGLAKRARSPLEEQRVLELDDLFGEALRSQKGD